MLLTIRKEWSMDATISVFDEMTSMYYLPIVTAVLFPSIQLLLLVGAWDKWLCS